jgi:predicted metal-dependent phosphoesterase TrpH
MLPISKADLHIHTHHSDGTASVPELLRYVAGWGELQVIAITDHDTIAGALEARRLASSFGVEVVVGEEVSTAEGHLLALFIEEWLPPGRPAAETIAAVHAQGGLCIAAHPFDRAVPSLGVNGLGERCAGLRAGEWQLDAIEAINASLVWPREGANLSAQRLGRERGLPLVGGSDSHSLSTVGRAYTTFPGASADDLRRALRAGTVGFGGGTWRAPEYLELGWLYLRQRNLRGALEVMLSDGAVPLRQSP